MKTNNTAESTAKAIMTSTVETVTTEMNQAKESWFEAAQKWVAAKWESAKLLAAKLLVKAARLLVSIADKANKACVLASTPLRAIWKAIRGLFGRVKSWLASQSMALYNEACAAWRSLEAYAAA